MRIVGAIVVSQPTGAVTVGTAELTYSGAIGQQAVSDDCLRIDALVFQQFPEQSQRCLLVPSFLHQHIEDFAFVTDGPPKIHPLPCDPHHHLIQVPTARGAGPCSLKIASEEPPELLCTASDGLMADINTTLGHEVFNITKTWREPEAQPNCLADDICWKPVASIGNRFHPLPSPIEPETSKSQFAHLSMAQVIDAH